jgi:hypothetical protein
MFASKFTGGDMSQTPAARFLKLNAAGGKQSDDAPTWSAVEDTRTGLIWSTAESKPMAWTKALTYPKTLDLLGFADWRLPTRMELLSLVDLTKYSPAIDTTYFPDCQNDWYWSSDPLASLPGGYWLVGFNEGYSSCAYQSVEGLVRAVRSRQ